MKKCAKRNTHINNYLSRRWPSAETDRWGVPCAGGWRLKRATALLRAFFRCQWSWLCSSMFLERLAMASICSTTRCCCSCAACLEEATEEQIRGSEEFKSKKLYLWHHTDQLARASPASFLRVLDLKWVKPSTSRKHTTAGLNVVCLYTYKHSTKTVKKEQTKISLISKVDKPCSSSSDSIGVIVFLFSFFSLDTVLILVLLFMSTFFGCQQCF